MLRYFLTRYQKGDLPEGVIPENAPWFICEFRYNENTHHFNRIRTWKACLPDEVRDDPEQPLVPLPETRKLIKYDSPIKDLLAPDAIEGMEIPDPIPGTANSPPLSGSVFIDAPLPNDDLGQYISSQNVVAVPEHNDPKSNRLAYLFTPISQLKGGGGSTNTVYATTPALPHGSPNHVPAKPITDTLGLAAARIAASTANNLAHSNKTILVMIQHFYLVKQTNRNFQELINCCTNRSRRIKQRSNKNNSYSNCNINNTNSCLEKPPLLLQPVLYLQEQPIIHLHLHILTCSKEVH